MATNKDEEQQLNNNGKKKEDVEQFRCKICFETFSRKLRCPLTLNCGHTFCRICTARLANDNKIQCGICRKYTYSDWSKLGKNITLIEMLDWAKLLNDEPTAGGEQLDEENATFDGPNQFIMRSNIEEFFDELNTLEQMIHRLPKKGTKALIQRNHHLVEQFYVIEQQLRNSAEAFEKLKLEVRLHHEKVTQKSINQIRWTNSIWEGDDDEDFGGATIRHPRFFEESTNGAFGSSRSIFSGRSMAIHSNRRQTSAANSYFGPSSSSAIPSNAWSTDEEENIFANAQPSASNQQQELAETTTPLTNDVPRTITEPNERMLIDIQSDANTFAEQIQPIVDVPIPSGDADTFGNSGFPSTSDLFDNSGFPSTYDSPIVDSFAQHSNQAQQGTSSTENSWGFGNRLFDGSNHYFGRSTFGGGTSTNSRKRRRRRNRNYWRSLANFATNPVPNAEWGWSTSDGWGNENEQQNESQPNQNEEAQIGQVQQNVVANEGNSTDLVAGYEGEIFNFSDWGAESTPRLTYVPDPEYNSLLGWESDEYEQMQIDQIMNEQMEEREIVENNELMGEEQQMEIEEENRIESIQVKEEIKEKINENKDETESIEEKKKEKNEKEGQGKKDEIENEDNNAERNEKEGQGKKDEIENEDNNAERNEKEGQGKKDEIENEDNNAERNEKEGQGKKDEIENEDNNAERNEKEGQGKKYEIEMEKNVNGGEEREKKSGRKVVEEKSGNVEYQQIEMEKKDEEENQDKVGMNENEGDGEEKNKKEDEVEIEENVTEKKGKEKEDQIGMGQTNMEVKEEEIVSKQMEIVKNGKLMENEAEEDNEKKNEEKENDVNANNGKEIMKEGGNDDEKEKMGSCSTDSYSPIAQQQFMNVKLGNKMVSLPLKKRSFTAFQQ